MRTTIEIEDKLFREVKKKAVNTGTSFRQVVEEALMIVFFPPKSKHKKFKVVPHHSSFKNGVDQYKLSEIIDELHTEEDLKRLKI